MSEFKEYSIAEFFKKNKQMLGFSGKVRSLTTIIHEYITNSLDACEEYGILPTINIKISETGQNRYKIYFEDNGPGLPESLIGKALGQMLAGTKFHRYMQQRGQQGIGAAGCTMYAIITTGKPIKVISKYGNKKISCDLSVDFKTNKPIIKNLIIENNEEGSGLIIEAEFGDVKYEESIRGVSEYLKRTAISNPHCEITLKKPNNEIAFFPRSSNQIPKKPKEVLPHPLGVSAHDIYEFAKNEKKYHQIKSFLQNRFSRVSIKKVKEISKKLPELDMKKHPNELTWQEAEKLKNVFKKIKWISPAMESVIPIGEEQIRKAIENILNPSFIAVSSRKPKVFQGGIPFIVETAIAYGNKTKSQIMRYANRVPLLFDSSGCALTHAVKSIDWKRYGIKNFEESNIVVFINLSSVHVPYTSAGKQSVAHIEEIVDEVRNAIQEAARSMNRYISSVVREKEREGKKKAIKRYTLQLSKDLVELAGIGNKDEIINKLNEIIEKKYGGTYERNI